MRTLPVAIATLLAFAVTAQSVAVFPSEYDAVAEGPGNSLNLPLAYGTSRVMVVYNRTDVTIPNGASIRKLGFREDTGVTTMSPGRGLQLEIRMGYTAFGEAQASSTFDQNWVGTPVTVFGPALYTLPNLRDTGSPLPNGRFFITLTTPFTYTPGTNNLLVEYRVFGTSGGGSQFNYYLDRADFYSPVASGPAGCTHTSGGPTVLSVQPVSINTYFTANFNAGPTNSFAILVLSLGSQLATPFSLQSVVPGIAPACMGQLSLQGVATMTVVTSAQGTGSLNFFVPNNMVYNDLFVSSQLAAFDFFAPGGVVVSNGSQVQIGCPPRTKIIYAQGPPATTTTGVPFNNYCPVAYFEYQ